MRWDGQPTFPPGTILITLPAPEPVLSCLLRICEVFAQLCFLDKLRFGKMPVGCKLLAKAVGLVAIDRGG